MTNVRTMVTGVLAAGAVASGVHSGLALGSAHREEAGRADAIAAASAEVTGLISVGQKTTAADIDRLKAGATASFASELVEQSVALRRALQAQKVTSTGSVASAGVVAWQPARARVLVAAVGNVANQQSDRSTPRAYRLRVDLRHVEGRWLVRDMEFVA
jgi:Mce-associated membrane protein